MELRTMNVDRISELTRIYRDGLLDDTMPFWMKHTIDNEYGGFLNYLDRDGTVLNHDKPVWVLARFTWLTATLYNNVKKRTQWLQASKLGIDFLEKHCFDADGRMFFEVNREGRPLRKRRYLYTEHFGAMAFSEYAIAARDEKRLKKARDIFNLILHYRSNPGQLPQKIFPQTRKTKSHAATMTLLRISQQMRKADANHLYDSCIERCMNELFDDFMKYEKKALLETVMTDGRMLEGVDGRCVNPGHAIETAWFLMQESEYRNDKTILDKACTILDWSLELGWDKKYGGILYFVDVDGKPPPQLEHDMKLWWPHTEAIYACLLAYYLTERKKYLHHHHRIHDYAYSHFPDEKCGEWFKYLHRDGSPASTLKGNRWAGPFHLPRMQLNCWKLLERIKKSCD